MIFISVCFKIIQYSVWITLYLSLWQLNIYFSYFTRPCLDYMVASSSKLLCTFNSCFKSIFLCLTMMSNNSISIMRVTFSASMSVTSVILKNSLRFMVVTVCRCTLNPSFTSMPASSVVNVNFTKCCFLFKPVKRFWRR